MCRLRVPHSRVGAVAGGLRRAATLSGISRRVDGRKKISVCTECFRWTINASKV